MAIQDLTVVVAVHNRDGLKNFIHTIIAQESGQPSVIVVDSSPDSLDRTLNWYLTGWAKDHYYLERPSDQFSKSKSLNAGLCEVTTKFTMFTDVDMMFHWDFFNVLSQMMGDNRFILAVAGYLPPDAPRHDIHGHWDELVSLAKQGEISHRLSLGACQCASTEWFKSVGGYDLNFKNLGGVDVNMLVRARKAGFEEVWIDDLMLLHQWHPKSELKGLDSHLFTPDVSIIANGGKLLP
jgi:hypothetical protein